MGKNVIIVAPDRRQRWLVVEIGRNIPVSRFAEKGDAIDFAVELGKSRFNSPVRVYNESGVTEAKFLFSRLRYCDD